jgi:uncharacterized integral membrane protein
MTEDVLMRIIILIILILLTVFSFGNIPFHSMEEFHMNPFSFVITIIALVMITGLLKEAIKQRQNTASYKKDLDEIKLHISQIEADIADIKEQIADFIIRTN